MSLRAGFRLGDWSVIPLEGRLTGDDEERRVQPKSMDVLLCLAEANGGVVERDEILRKVWGDRAVSDEPLTRCIGELRRALGDSRDNPRYIVTVPKRGYRLLESPIPFDVRDEPSSDPPELTTAQSAVRRSGLRKLAVGVGILVLAAGVEIVLERIIDPPPDDSGSAIPVAASRSIAVLPFVDMTAEQDQQYFGDGLAEELTNLLAHNPALSVASRTSSFQFRDATISAGEIARQLAVENLVEGSVRRSGDRLRVTAQLVDPGTGYHLWSESFDEGIGDIFAIQDRITQQIAATLEVSVLGDQVTARRTDPEAYSLFLHAKYQARQGTLQSFETALELAEESLLIDPRYAPAWSLMADVYNNLAGQGFWDWERGFSASREAALKATDVGPDYAGGHAELAWIAHRHDGDIQAAFAHMQRALEINSMDTDILPDAAVLLIQAGKLDQAISVLRYCIRRAPTNVRLRFNLGMIYKYDDQLETAERMFREVREINPDYSGVDFQLAEIHLLNGEPDEALALWQAMDGYRKLKGTAAASYDMDDLEQSDTALAELIETWGETWPGAVADVHAHRGQLDEAFAWLDRDYEKYGAGGWGEVKLQRWYDNLREDPRWDSLLQRVGFTDEQTALLELNIDIPSLHTDR